MEQRPDALALSDSDQEMLSMLMEAMDSAIESWLTSSIACCDTCYDDFVHKWPLAFVRTNGVHTNRVDVDTFYRKHSRVNQLLSHSDYLRLLPYVACPRCGESIGRHLYPFEFPFDPQLFANDLQRLGRLAEIAPFLLLADPFAEKVRKAIERLCNDGSTGREVTGPLFRGRRLETIPRSEDFLPPVPEITREGRYNHAGRPVLYLASNTTTCWEECRRPRDNFYIAEISIRLPIRVLDLTDSEAIGDELSALVYSNLMAAPTSGEGWARPEYVLSRFVGDCARRESIDAIKYPSTRSGNGDNVVLLNPRQLPSAIGVLNIVRHD